MYGNEYGTTEWEKAQEYEKDEQKAKIQADIIKFNSMKCDL